ncbi:enoyl-CoA hydratase/isomerase family protein [Arvimicrobium flavum]|uniref:enoyl-CoA hydratase/isomerase family protein n=1 Tax=Arvimicrobium flavum TaxID=3393320 RepID=UPI00237BFFF7|nr:enoyl-CoA hydratase/isomerase family protein [Mesorhizobium shangrilense]
MSETADCIRLERSGSVLLVVLNRPDAFNAINADMHRALSQAWHEASDDAVRAVVVTGEGRGFCAGADLKSSGSGSPATSGLRHTFNPHMLAYAALRKPVIAAINGAAAGAGLALAFGADIRIGSPQAKFVPAFVDIGLAPDAGSSYFVTRVLGYSRAFDWLTSGRRLDAQIALEMGILREIVEPDQLRDRALAVAEDLASKPGQAVNLTKELLAQASARGLAAQLEAEAAAQRLAIADPDRAAARARVVTRISSK